MTPLVISHDLMEKARQVSVRVGAETTVAEVAPLGVQLPPGLQGAVPKRQIEWTLGRYCARLAGRDLGIAGSVEIGTGADRAPRWPSGLVGSITHTKGFVSAALARRESFRSLGIDSEVLMSESTLAEVRKHVATPEEEALADRYLSWLEPRAFFTLVFSAKESSFKCLYPLVGRFFSYQDAAIRALDFSQSRFEIELLTDLTAELGKGSRYQGTFRIDSPLIHTGIALAAR